MILLMMLLKKQLRNGPKAYKNFLVKKSINTLKARRNNLRKATIELYEYLAEQVEILGSDKKELIQIEKISTDELKITLKKVSRKEDIQQVLYERRFYANETKEVRIYGLGGDDIFQISGDESNKIKVRII
ncbi:MAG: hypothetical protein NWS46_04580 [Cyclobacteriaceae bacterium]|nr:hypothetical protein [Cyclobacteriaceae bacterium]